MNWKQLSTYIKKTHVFVFFLDKFHHFFDKKILTQKKNCKKKKKKKRLPIFHKKGRVQIKNIDRESFKIG